MTSGPSGEPRPATDPMSEALLVERAGPVLRVTFNRPEQRNAMTWSMYDGLLGACREADDDPDVRAMVLRGAGGDAFVAGTDIAQFAEFDGGASGVEYERRMTALLDRLGAVRVPTVAVVTGFCVGAGLAIAAACDLRVATRTSRFGVPIARTLGNCLSTATMSLLVSHFGQGRTLDLLLRARMMTAQEAYAAGFVTELCEPGDVDATASAVVDRLVEHAPLTMWAAKEAVRRLRTSRLPDDADILRRVYGSDDFRSGVRAFVAKEHPSWTGT